MPYLLWAAAGGVAAYWSTGTAKDIATAAKWAGIAVVAAYAAPHITKALK